MKRTSPLLLLLVAFSASVCQAQTPVLYGLTVMGGDYTNGNIFQYTAGNVKSVYSFGSIGDDGNGPWGSLVYANNKKLYGMTKLGGSKQLGTLFSYDIYTGQEVPLHSFTNSGGDGAGPNGSLIQATNNLLYGMTTSGGTAHIGTIFSYDIVKDTELALYSFAGGTNDGLGPYGSLTQVNDSMLYGLTLLGGANDSGTIFSYNINSGRETLLHSFMGNVQDGGYPWGSLLYASDGLLYGMTNYGGADSMGTIFSYNISTATEAVVHSFKMDTLGRYPNGSFIQAKNGLLYGTTVGSEGAGAIFSFNTVTKTEKLVYNFTTLSSGERPYGAVMQASDGKLYGMTSAGGVNNDGILFSYDIQDSTLTKILDFNGPLGWEPYFSNLVEADTAGITTGINELTLNNNQLTIYPNPSTGQFTLKLSDKEKGSLIEVYNVVGENVYQSVANNLSNTINLDAQPEGIYFVYLKSAEGFVVKKMMITR